MTPAATHFIGQLTFEALTGEPVMTEVLETGAGIDGPSAIRHISWAKWADVAVIAPLSASSMARLAHGLADNALTTVWLALPEQSPNFLCPAMNTQMWDNPITQRNIEILRQSGRYRFIDPINKRLACGDVGVGGLEEPENIMKQILQ